MDEKMIYLSFFCNACQSVFLGKFPSGYAFIIRRGLKIIKGNKERIAEMLSNMLTASGAERIIYLIHALIEISKCEEVEILTS